MARNRFERHLLPLSETVRQFDVIRIRAERRAAELSGDVSAAPIRGGDAESAPFGFELRVKSGDGLIVGRIDRVLATREGTVIQDYKSGAISIDDDGKSAIRPEYVNQLRLYAALYYETTHVWPARLELVPLTGPPQDVAYSKMESMKALDSARELLTRVNEDLAGSNGDWDHIERSLADPSPEACRFCAYRPGCLPYLSTRPVGDRSEWPLDFWGEFGRLTKLGNGMSMISLTAEGGLPLFIRGINPASVEDAALLSIDGSAVVGIFNGRRMQDPRVLDQGWLTAIYWVRY
jgi:hypothetical protein